jgi:hypothetical protein
MKIDSNKIVIDVRKIIEQLDMPAAIEFLIGKGKDDSDR